jgi:hypothetical protein
MDYHQINQINEKIKDLQKELDSLIEKKKTLEDSFIPEGFNPVCAEKCVNGKNCLRLAFRWSSTPQGDEYWRQRTYAPTLDPLDTIIILKWIVNYYKAKAGCGCQK